MMNVNHNTISRDINVIYNEIAKQDDQPIHKLVTKQCLRLDQQRTRLVEKLTSTLSITETLAIEKLIADLDNKLL